MPDGLRTTSNPIDPNRICDEQGVGNEDYVGLVMLPIFGTGIAPYAGTQTDEVTLSKAGMRAVFWYWYNNRLPCCGEPDLGDAAFQVAQLVGAHVFPEVANQAEQELIAEIRASGEIGPGGCPNGVTRRPVGALQRRARSILGTSVRATRR